MLSKKILICLICLIGTTTMAKTFDIYNVAIIGPENFITGDYDLKNNALDVDKLKRSQNTRNRIIKILLYKNHRVLFKFYYPGKNYEIFPRGCEVVLKTNKSNMILSRKMMNDLFDFSFTTIIGDILYFTYSNDDKYIYRINLKAKKELKRIKNNVGKLERLWRIKKPGNYFYGNIKGEKNFTRILKLSKDSLYIKETLKFDVVGYDYSTGSMIRKEADGTYCWVKSNLKDKIVFKNPKSSYSIQESFFLGPNKVVLKLMKLNPSYLARFLFGTKDTKHPTFKYYLLYLDNNGEIKNRHLSKLKKGWELHYIGPLGAKN